MKLTRGWNNMGYDLFKGYVPTRDKKCLTTFKNKSSDELYTLKDVSGMPEFAGVLNDDTVLIDIDDYAESEILMNIVEDLQLKCRVYETSRGKHFMFKNGDLLSKNSTGAVLACSLMSDIKLGKRCSYSILKFNDKDRKIIYDIFPDEDYDILPKWLMPVKSKMSFLDMSEGDGRNQEMFNYILTLQSNDFSKDESRECLKIINKYILKTPLSDDELNTLSRDDAFKKPVFYKGNTFLFDKFATFIKNNNHVIKLGGRLHIYQDGIYKSGDSAIETEMIKHMPGLSYAKRTEVIRYLNLLIANNEKPALTKYIAFKNGVYDLESDTLESFNQSIIITNKINFNYNPGAYSEVMDRTLNKLSCDDNDVRALLEECVGYCFFRRNELRKAFILTGGKRNGKSTFLDLLNYLLGTENISNLDLKELGMRFKTAELFGKLANIGDDIGDEFISDTAIFKKLVSGNPINVEQKHGNPFDFSNYAKLLFSANEIPRMRDKTGAVIDRLIIIPFNAVFSPDDADFDPYIKDKLLTDEAMEYIIQLGLQGLKRVLQRRQFTTSEKVKKSIEEYEERNNPMLLFVKEIDENDVVNNSTKAVYRKYNEFCLSDGFTAISNIEFSRQISKMLGMKSVNKKINNKSCRVFVKE